MRGTYRAFLTSRVQNLDSIVHLQFDKTIPIVNVKVTITKGRLELVDGGHG